MFSKTDNCIVERMGVLYWTYSPYNLSHADMIYFHNKYDEMEILGCCLKH